MNKVLGYIVKYQLLYWLLLILLVAITVVRLTTLDVGFCTAWDEAYFLIKLREAYEGSIITGKSQWNLLAIHWFPYLDLTNPIHSRISIYLCEFFGTILTTLTCVYAFGKRNILKYITLSYLLFLQIDTTYAGDSLNYVPMQALLLAIALCGVILYKHTKPKLRMLWMIPTGTALGLAIFVIMPSSVLLIGAICLLILIDKDWKSIPMLLLGIFIAVLYVHIFVCNLFQIYEAMQFTAAYFTKSGYRYSPTDMLIQLGLLARDGLLCLLVCFGICFLSKTISRYSSWIIATLCMLLSFLAYTHYQTKPQTSISLIILSIIVYINIIASTSRMTRGKLNLYSVFLILFPLVASIGTNTYLGNRMICFAIAWMFLLLENQNVYRVSMDRLPFIAILCILLLLKIVPSSEKLIPNRDAHFTRGNPNFAQLALTNDQVDYLDNVLDILNAQGYTPDSSIVFTSEYDWSTIYAIDAKLSSNFHQKRNFLYFPKEEMLKPDFIFLCEWDKMEIGEALHEMPWGWPQEFDSIFVGSPEGKDFPWDADRWLYYRK